MSWVALMASRMSGSRGRPIFGGGGMRDPINSHSSPVKSVSYLSIGRLYCSRVVSPHAMRPSLSDVEVSGQMPGLGRPLGFWVNL